MQATHSLVNESAAHESSSRVGSICASALGALMIAFFVSVKSTTAVNPVADTAGFLTDAAAHPGPAAFWAFGPTLVALAYVPFFFALCDRLSRAAKRMRVAVGVAVLASAVMLVQSIILYPLMFSLAPSFVAAADDASRASMLTFANFVVGMVATSATIAFVLRSVSVFLAGLAMLREGGAWRRAGWLGIAFGIEHFVGAVAHHFVQGGGAVGKLSGAATAVLFIAWLTAVIVALSRKHA